MKKYYIISVETGEYTSRDKRICNSFEEAKSHIKEYADWYCGYGSCTINEIDENFEVYQRWIYRNNKLLEHKNFK